MDWDALLHPVGPLPASTYWMRRAVVLGGFLVVLILIIVLATGGSSAPKPKSSAKTDPGIVLPSVVPSTRSSSTASATPSSSDDGGTGPTCTDSQLAISVDVVAQRYPNGSLPQFVVSVTNTSSTTCRRDVGADARTLTVTSGSDRIWSSADCGTKAKDLRTLTPGQVVKLNSSWNRERSLPGCSTTAPAGQNAAVGVYLVKLQLGTLGPTQGANFNLS